MPELKEVIISITSRCNARCRMCDIPAKRSDELSGFIWERLIKDAAELGARTVVFSGGEPLLREDIFKLISCVRANRMQACVTSNGYFLSDEVAAKLASAGACVVNISVEGPRDIHEQLRGRDSFDKALSALQNLKKHNIESTIATVISRYNYRHLTDVVELAREYGVTTIKFQPFSGIFLESDRKTKEFLLPASAAEELSAVMKRVSELCDGYGITANPRGYLERVPFYLTKKITQPQHICAALKFSCPIDPGGSVYPCWVTADKDNRIGNIQEESLLSLWGSERRNSIIERIKQHGCPGCMMSCYDDNFGKEALDLRVAVNIGRLKREGLRVYTKRFIKRWAKRIKFYLAYRGSPRVLIGRSRKLFAKRSLGNGGINQKEIDAAFEEIKKAKQILQREINNSK